MSNATFVTGFIDIDRIERTGRRGWDEYRERFKWLLGLPIDLVVYAETDHALEISRMPRRANIDIIETDIDSFVNPDTVRALQDAIDRINDGNVNKRKDTPLLTLVGKQKVEWLAEQAKLNLFGSKHLWWVDFGIAWEGLPKPESEVAILRAANEEHPIRAEGISICSVTYVPHAIVEDQRKYYSRYWWPVASGWFGGKEIAIDRMHCAFVSEWRDALAHGCAPFDEMVHGRVMMDENRPWIYKPHYGDYRSCIANTFEAKLDHELILWMSNRARYFDDIEAADARFNAIRSHMTPQQWKVYDL